MDEANRLIEENKLNEANRHIEKMKLNKKVFFIIKYWLIGSIDGTFVYIAILLLGKIDLLQFFVISLLNLTGLSLVIGRLLDKEITWATLKVAKLLEKIPIVKNLITDYM